MLLWISDNLSTLIICALLIAAVISIIVCRIRAIRLGHGCSCGCSDCPMNGSCGRKK